MIAYLMRYGHQPYSEIMAIPIDDLHGIAEEISAIVEEENEKSKAE